MLIDNSFITIISFCMLSQSFLSFNHNPSGCLDKQNLVQTKRSNYVRQPLA
jgi:hypothetical protein